VHRRMSIWWSAQILEGETHLSWGMAETRRWEVGLLARRVRVWTWRVGLSVMGPGRMGEGGCTYVGEEDCVLGFGYCGGSGCCEEGEEKEL